MKFLFPKEKLLLEMIIKQNPAMGQKLQEAIQKIYIHLPEQLLHEKYDSKLIGEFLHELVKNTQKLGVEKYYSVVTEDETAHALQRKCLAETELHESIFKALGSYGPTKLIQDMLKKMSETKFSKKEMKNLVILIEARNKIRQNEEQFLEQSFRAYLQKQINLYSILFQFYV